ncbi:MAM and LDL-receptor class A domain-containing protein 1 [Nymphon striatum]|nr:MAM and LDL-receptor class A domain-containing protein 1 [Nymphon striatum]
MEPRSDLKVSENYTIHLEDLLGVLFRLWVHYITGFSILFSVAHVLKNCCKTGNDNLYHFVIITAESVKFVKVIIDDISLSSACAPANESYKIPGEASPTKTTDKCAPDGFQCRNGNCYTREQRCNFVDDCHDNTDELFCGMKVSPYSVNISKFHLSILFKIFVGGECGWYNIVDSELTWIRSEGSTQRFLTHPSVDHTTHSAKVQLTMVKKQFFTLICSIHLLLPCTLQFWYSAFSKYGNEASKLQLWSSKKTDEANWTKAVVDIGHQSDFAIQFEAIHGNSRYSDVTIDDVKFLKCAAQHNYGDCSFDSESWSSDCHWSVSKSSDFMWVLSPKSKKPANGLLRDHTLHIGGGTNGYFLLADSYGQVDGATAIYLKDSSDISTLVFEISGNQGPQWNYIQKPLWHSKSYRIQLIAVVGNSEEKSDIAIDDIHFSKHCQDGGSQKKLVIPTCPKMFMCVSKQNCIPKSWECDCTPDCLDGSDEHNCIPKTLPTSTKIMTTSIFKTEAVTSGVSTTVGVTPITQDGCKKGEVNCGNGTDECVSSLVLCDGIKDCANGADEDHGCPKSTCKQGYYFCRGRKHCLPASDMCNGHVDCTDGSDENNCNKTSAGLIIGVVLSIIIILGIAGVAIFLYKSKSPFRGERSPIRSIDNPSYDLYAGKDVADEIMTVGSFHVNSTYA